MDKKHVCPLQFHHDIFGCLFALIDFQEDWLNVGERLFSKVATYYILQCYFLFVRVTRADPSSSQKVIYAAYIPIMFAKHDEQVKLICI